MPRIILHTGTPKTGSTSFQRTLRANRGLLRERGLVVVPTGSARDLGELKLAACLFGQRGADAEATRAAFWEIVAAETGRDIILSAESIAAVMQADGGAALAEMVERGRRTGHSVEFVTCLRHLPAHFGSQYSQIAKTFHAQRSFEGYVRHHIAPPHYLRLQAEQLLRTGLSTTFIPFNAETRRMGVERAILTALGHDPEGLKRIPPANERVGICQIAVSLSLTARLRATHDISLEHVRAMRLLVEEACAKAVPDDPRYSPLTPALAAEIEAAFLPEADAFARDVWGRPWREVFAEDLGCTKPTSTIDETPEPERFRAAARAVLAEVLPGAEAVLAEAPSGSWRSGQILRRLGGLAHLDGLGLPAPAASAGSPRGEPMRKQG